MWINSILIAASITSSASSKSLNLEKALENLAKESRGRIGICVMPINAEAVCVKKDDRFPLQSVMKLVVAVAVLDLVDQKRLNLDDMITLTPKDASPGPQEFAELIAKKGKLSVTIEELIRHSIIESDSTSVDVLLEHIGGVSIVQEYLRKKKIEGLNIDRNERNLQAEFSGLKWRTEFSDPKKFDVAIKALPVKLRNEALTSYLNDPRDTASPQGMVNFLVRLKKGELLSDASSQKILSIMEATITGRDRLPAGLPKGWRLAHKTGTSGSWNGVAAATNDVGLMMGPKGEVAAIAVFVADSTAPDAERAAVIAKAATLATSSVSE